MSEDSVLFRLKAERADLRERVRCFLTAAEDEQVDDDMIDSVLARLAPDVHPRYAADYLRVLRGPVK